MLHLKKLPFFLASTRSHSHTWPSRLSLSFQLRPAMQPVYIVRHLPQMKYPPRIKYPRVLLGLLFILVIIVMLFVYSNSASSPTPYLTIPSTNGQVAGQAEPAGPVLDSMPQVPIPVTGP